MMLLLALLFGCEDPRIKSAERAKAHVAALSKAATADVADVRSGMPEGAKRLVKIFATEGGLPDDAAALKKALRLTRGRVQDLRVAKSTFFALVNADGVAMRSNQPVDELSGKSVLKGFPELKTALAGRYIETTGSMNALRGVNTKPDGQWMSAHPVKKDDKVLGLYITGWAWSRYAYRLEFKLRGDVQEALRAADTIENEPLLYVFVLVDGQAYGAGPTPHVSADAVAKLNALSHVKGSEPYVTVLEITGRGYGVAVMKVPALGANVGIAVLRSET